MITIDQLLESVDLDFEPRWVTKDEDGCVAIWEQKPEPDDTLCLWCCQCGLFTFRGLKLAEFDGKDWTECIYEVPRKTDEYEQNLEKLRPADSDLVYRVNLPRKTTGKIKKLQEFDRTEASIFHAERLYSAVNNLVDAVNELKGAKNE